MNRRHQERHRHHERRQDRQQDRQQDRRPDRRQRRRTAAAVLLAALPLTGLALTGCAGIDRALDCAQTAATVAGDIQDLQSTATNVGQVSDPSRLRATVNALDKVQADLKKLGDGASDSDVSDAVAALDTAVRNARTSAAGGRTPDLTPVGSAASHLTGVCTPG